VGIAIVLAAAALLYLGLRSLALAVAVPGVVLATYAEWAKCPHCGKKFARRGVFHNSFTRKCLNCGVRLGTPKAAK
jgi:predicted RNA-binding Zn-ribbon protein involved in translation (DUF1610 family)